jgi:hypothetical protein
LEKFTGAIGIPKRVKPFPHSSHQCFFSARGRGSRLSAFIPTGTSAFWFAAFEHVKKNLFCFLISFLFGFLSHQALLVWKDPQTGDLFLKSKGFFSFLVLLFFSETNVESIQTSKTWERSFFSPSNLCLCGSVGVFSNGRLDRKFSRKIF